MDSEALPSSRNVAKCCNCECSCTLMSGSSGSWIRSVKRKYAELDEEGNRFFIPGLEVYYNAKVQVDHECNALREALSSQQQTIQDLYTELDEERNASSSAANEAMSMILRLQREKAEIQMEARQFKLFVEEKMAHDQRELVALEDLLYKREQTIQALTCEVQAYKHRMMSYGLSEAEADGAGSVLSRNQSMGDCESQYDLPTTPIYEYPPLKCKINETQGPLEEDDVADIEKYAFGETPRDQLKNLENRLYQMERCPSNNQLEGDFSGSKHIYEKGVIGHSPRRSRNSRIVSNESTPYSAVVREAGADFFAESPRYSSSFKRAENVSHPEDYSNMRKLDNASEIRDDTSDRIYTIDSVHNGAPYSGFNDAKPGIYGDYESTPRGSLYHTEDPDIMKLYMRLQALEADRESMRQTMLSMRTDKAQLVLLKEIAQHLYKDMSPDGQVIVNKQSGFSFMSVFKWVKSFVFWRRRARRSKYMFGLSANVGLLMLLDKGPHTRQWRCLTSTQI
ncbi:PREDICTED: myosin-binding protein 7-like [Fragaria vesca subsp. vesca]|uniref:myosin-binding protein 7-like n=1 Tax=Fragaria vesca subsp. vesca TaxID=101020 RepID=UPI0002C35999|nr:PREDICTED: myosin-binding protein 7-like [Fragaria vesca subsp. vesca]XP_011467161.1 PREDICTED: myosin-binding protein 7-like [Fragaria vesca subsp. vesca]